MYGTQVFHCLRSSGTSGYGSNGLFTRAILENRPIDVFNQGKMKRDFTYIDDVVEGLIRVVGKISTPDTGWISDIPDSATSYAPYRIYNIGNNNTVELMKFIGVLEECIGRNAEKNFLPMQSGDVPGSYADVDDLVNDIGFKPSTSIEKGIKRFVEWYLGYYTKT